VDPSALGGSLIAPVAASLLAGIGAGCLVGGLGLVRGSAPLRRVALGSGARGPGATDPREILARIGRSSIAMAIVGLAIGLALPWPGPALAPVLATIGWRVPLVTARRTAARRRTAIDAELPQLLDLVAAASSAGLSAQLALRRAADAVEGPLAVELERMFARVDLGARWRDELADLAGRTALPDLRRVVSTLTRTETLGTSLESSTIELAANVRASRRAAITERARTAPVKMLFPLVFLVLPAFLLLTVVPILLTTLRSIR
jgi:tight adherence protein C